MCVIFIAHLCLQARVHFVHAVITFEVAIICTIGNDGLLTLTGTSYSVSEMKSGYNVDVCNM